MDKWEYQNEPCYLENCVLREQCKRRTARITESLLNNETYSESRKSKFKFGLIMYPCFGVQCYRLLSLLSSEIVANPEDVVREAIWIVSCPSHVFTKFFYPALFLPNFCKIRNSFVVFLWKYVVSCSKIIMRSYRKDCHFRSKIIPCLLPDFKIITHPDGGQKVTVT